MAGVIIEKTSTESGKVKIMTDDIRVGSIIIQQQFPRPWPVDAVYSIYKVVSLDRATVTTVIANPSGSISFVLLNQGRPIIQYTSPRIIMSNYQRIHAVLAFVWEKDSPLKFFIDGQEVDKNDVHLNKIAPFVDTVHTSIDHPDRLEKCAVFVERRRKEFVSTDKIRPNTIAVPEEEQFDQLKSAVQNLIILLEQSLSEQGNFYGHLATELRALLYYKDGRLRSYQYNPLLLRIAGSKGIELPVFFIPSIVKTELTENAMEILDEAVYRVFDPFISIRRYHHRQQLNDLCCCLEQSVIRMQVEGKTFKDISLKDVILNATVSLGAAHYDPEIPKEICLIKNIFSMRGDNTLKKLIRDLTDTTINCANSVLARIELEQTGA